MKTISRYIMTLALLLTAATGAWADETYTVKFEANGNTVTKENVTLPYTFACNFVMENGELDGIIQQLYNLQGGSCDSENTPSAIGNSNVTAGKKDNGSHYITISGPFEGTSTVTGSYSNYSNVFTYTLEISIPGYVAPAETDVEVTTNAASEGATFTEATFAMPAYDATADYELVRDMEIDVNAVIANRIRIKKGDNGYEAVTATELMPVIIDKLDEQNPVTMVLFNATNNTGDYTVKLQKKVEGDTPSWADAEVLSVGTFRYVITGTNLYDGEITTNEFTLFEGFEVTVPAGEYATFYKDENLYVEDPEAQLYTITSVGTETATATELTVAKANMPILVKNNGQEKKVILLIPTTNQADEVTVASEFVGTLEATTIAASSENQNNYAFNGKQFVWVKNAIEVGPNRAWLHILTGAQSAPVLTIVFGDATGVNAIDNGQLTIDNWYDLNGRKLQGIPTKKGVYIMNGRKVVVK